MTSTPAVGGFGSFSTATPAPSTFGPVGGSTFGTSGMDTMESSSNSSFAAPAPFAPTQAFMSNTTPSFGAAATPNQFTANVGGFGQPPAAAPFGFNSQAPAFGSAPQTLDGGFQMGAGTKRRMVRARRP